MNAILQTMALRLYKWACLSGLLSTEFGRCLFEWGYNCYKRWLETGDIEVLSSLIEPGAVVVDVGANIGFFTRRFASWVSKKGYVLAIEPEPANFKRLTRMLLQYRLQHLVEPIQGAACEQNGEVKLRIDPFHPAGHCISEEGMVVRAFTLDHLLSERGWPWVGLIKIDVQGAEERVLRGAREILSRFHPALFIEVDELALNAMGSDVDGLLRFLVKYHYQAYHIDHGQPRLLPDREQFNHCLSGGYTDFLFLVNRTMHDSLPLLLRALRVSAVHRIPQDTCAARVDIFQEPID